MITSLNCDRKWHDLCNGLILAGGSLYDQGHYLGEKYVHAACECTCHRKGDWMLMGGTSGFARATKVLVIDDMRLFDWECEYARTLKDGMERILDRHGWDEVWLDHDLGGDDTIRPIVRMLEERAFNGDPVRIGKIWICTDNPVGREWIESSLHKYYQTESYVPRFKIPKSGI